MTTTSDQVLAHVRAHGGWTAGDIAGRLGMSAATASRALRDLRSRNLVSRERGDGRALVWFALAVDDEAQA